MLNTIATAGKLCLANREIILTKLNQSRIRFSSFLSSERFAGVDRHPEVEVIRSPPEWKYVEDLLPQKVVPKVMAKLEYPSTWKPPTIDPTRTPYMISRNRNHMMPIYLIRTHRGMRRLTVVKRIEGDIWSLHDELKAFVENSVGKAITTRVNEMNGHIQLRGDYVLLVHGYLQKKGF